LLSWVEKQFDTIKKGQKVVPFFHIWPGINYMSHQNLHWKQPYIEQFEQMITANRDKVILLIGAHTHFSNFMYSQEGESLADNLWISPSLSPIFNNNPGISIFDISTDER
jgi:hypothetical protein